jgi:hypothetical protein
VADRPPPRLPWPGVAATHARPALVVPVDDDLVNRPGHGQALLPAEFDEVREDLLERIGRPTSE